MIEVLNQEYNFDFDEKRKLSMVESFYKYGSVKENYKTFKTIDAVATLKKKLQMYEDTGNIDFLIDVGNYAMIEFTYSLHPNAHYFHTDTGKSEVVGMSVNEIKEFKESEM
jgi:hypothetical protein